jgi:uroporphyrinogen III methyltransferase/synthase
MIVVGEVVTLRSRLQFFEKQPLFGKRFLVPKIGREVSRLAAMLREHGAQVEERMVGQIVGIPAVYTAKELSQVDLLLFTSSNGVQYFMRNLFASSLDVRALAHAGIIAIGPKTADKLKSYGLRADLVPDHYNSESLAASVRQLLEARSANPFVRAIAWYPTAKNADDDLVDALLEFCDCGRLNVYENVPCTSEYSDASGAASGDTLAAAGISPCDSGDALDTYDGILFTSASSVRRILSPTDEETRALLGTRTAIYSIGPKCSAALTALGVTPITEAAVSTYEGLLNSVLHR